MTAFRSSFLMAGVFGLALLTSCTQFGYKVREIQSAVPYYRINLKEHGAPGIQEYFFLGLHCLDPLTVVFAGYTGGGQTDPNHYYALVRSGKTWKKVHLTGKLQLYAPAGLLPGIPQHAEPPDGRLYDYNQHSKLPRGFSLRPESDSFLPKDIDFSWLNLSRAKSGSIDLYHFDEHDITKSLVLLNFTLMEQSNESGIEIYNWKSRRQLVKLEMNGGHIWSLKYRTGFRYERPEFHRGFALLQTNLQEAFIFDLRSYWPQNPNPWPIDSSALKCVPLV